MSSPFFIIDSDLAILIKPFHYGIYQANYLADGLSSIPDKWCSVLLI